MKYLAAYLLLALAGNNTPSAEDIKSVLSAVGIDAEEERLQKLLAELEGKDLQEKEEAAEESDEDMGFGLFD
ncbi:Mitochondrial ribosomal protein subunit family protein [Aspergillus niger]|uniref:Mitochondrial ribosomal protein subunit family protein n=1 Tax=Aspergillus niger TaxID=5061 RepID=A0A505IED6_ASPNG|nr:Mitochondrial ribosomal protein subunit family protein [Aspergillus niger]